MRNDKNGSTERPRWLDPKVILLGALVVWSVLTACSWAEFGTDRARDMDPTGGKIIAPRSTEVPTLNPNSWAAQLTKTAEAQK